MPTTFHHFPATSNLYNNPAAELLSFFSLQTDISVAYFVQLLNQIAYMYVHEST